MKKLMVFAAAAMMAGSAMADTGWMDSYAYFWNGTADTYYDLNGATVNPDLQGANLGTFELTSTFFLNSQINAWANNGDTFTTGSIWWRLGTSGAYTEQQDTSWESQGGNDWRAITPGVDLIAAAGAAGSYTLQVYLERDHSWDGGSATIALDQAGANASTTPWEATFTINPAAVPEPATMSLLGLGALAMVIRRKIRK